MLTETQRTKEYVGEYMGQDFWEFPGLPGYWNESLGQPCAYTAGFSGVRTRVLTQEDCVRLREAAQKAGL